MRHAHLIMKTSHTQSHMISEKKVRGVIEKIVVNAGVGKAGREGQFEDKILPRIVHDVSLLAGQKPHTRGAKQAIASFRLREGQVVGLRVTLRGKKMVDFFERLVTIVLPRTPDFHGISLEKIDEGGALHVGFREQFVFPEINPEESTFAFSLGVNIVPKKKKKGGAVEMYRELGVPLQK